MDIQEVLKIADHLVFNHTGKHLDDRQKTVLEGVWEGKKYTDIADNIHCSEGYVRDTASDLWKILSNLSGEDVNKSNFRSALERLQFSVSSTIGLNNVIGITNNLSLCSDRITPLENSRNGKNRQTAAQNQSESHINSLPSQDIREAPDIGKIWGRVNEISILENWILEENIRLVGILGISGIGKTTLSRHLLEKISNNFDYIIWKNLYHSPLLPTLVRQLISSLSSPTHSNFLLTDINSILDLELAELLSILFEYLREYRCLIILDNVQEILAEGKLAGNYKNQFENYGQFFKNMGQLSHSSCFILNSWEAPLELINLTGLSNPVKLLSLNGIGENAIEIFKEYNLSDQEHWLELINTYRGHPDELKTIARMIQDLFNGKIGDYLKYNSLFLGDETVNQLNRHFQRISLLEKQIILELSQINQPVTVTEISQKSPLSSSELFQGIQSLGRRSLIEKMTQDKLTLFTVSPVIKEYVKMLEAGYSQN
ncbi:NB-ARC domain-containing protein [Planktothrix pseudagardhii]|uniref:WD repeat-containing protein alr2800 n=1 Tax=Planktothrix pseudagardhii TaxID=132604 RepID=A0A9W4D8C2_9CYAN|nr:NB-ARC domain-containing protein [Planktothrix pseudagardhii]CAD5961430.1 putative WD repeat-containing protein alr2800 [Planktothrix pseudagardhii]